jgi:putative transposase
MNTRDYKKCAPGEYYHIYNRGNAKDVIFRDRDDYQFFLLRLQQALGKAVSKRNWSEPLPPDAFSIVAYCLMPNHFHFLIRQNMEYPTSKLMVKVCTSYVKYFNNKYGRVGHLFQDQFKQKNVAENGYLLWLSAYIHRNPVSAGLAHRPEDWQWSSVREYLPGSHGGLTEHAVVTDQLLQGDYSTWLDGEGSTVEQRFAQDM